MAPQDYSVFALQLRELSKGWTDKDLADALAVAKSTVNGWKHDRGSPNPENIAKLCRVLECSADQLLGVEAPAGYISLEEHRREIIRALMDLANSIELAQADAEDVDQRQRFALKKINLAAVDRYLGGSG